MAKYTHILREAMTHVRRDPRRTLAILDAGIAQAVASGDALEVARLAKQAGAVAGPRAERRYYELAVLHDPRDPGSLNALGSCREHDGDADGATEAYRRALSLAVELGDAAVVELARHCLWKLATRNHES